MFLQPQGKNAPERTPPRTTKSPSPDLKIEDQCQLQPTTEMVGAIERTIHVLHPQLQALYLIGIYRAVDLVERQYATARDHARLARLSCPRRPRHSALYILRKYQQQGPQGEHL
jgi:hypothetical protein